MLRMLPCVAGAVELQRPGFPDRDSSAEVAPFAERIQKAPDVDKAFAELEAEWWPK